MSGLPEVHLSNLNYTAGHWLPRPDREDHFDLNAPYQRGSVWTTGQRRALIQSLYMGLPIGSVIVSALPYRKGNPYAYRVVDGKQRIETIRAFMADEFEIPGWWLRDEDRPEGMPEDAFVTWSQLGRGFQTSATMHWSVPALEFKPEHEWMGRDAAGQPIWRTRNDDEILAAEAEVYGLINGAGTLQTEADLARAASIARSAR